MIRLQLTDKAVKGLEGLARHEQERMRRALDRLADQWPVVRLDVKRLAGLPGLWRLRVGDHRAIFQAAPDRLVITRIAHRSVAYR